MFINTTVDFRGVGQGLFIFGQTCFLPIDRQDARGITWVYDCGSTSEEKIKSSALSLIHPFYPGFDIDFVVISHLDNDHIRGLPTLLKLSRVGKIFLPAQEVPHRLLWGIESLEQGVSPQQLQGLVTVWRDPVAYIRGLTDRNGQTPEIVLIPSAEGQAPRPEQANRDTIDTNRREPLMITRDPKSSERDITIDSNVRFLREGTSVVWYDMWEFVPYVDPWYRDVLLDISADERDILDSALNEIIETSKDQNTTEDDLWTMIKNFKSRLYSAISDSKTNHDRSHKVSDEDKNAISLMAYFGAVDPIGEIVLADVPKTYQDADTSSLPGFPFGVVVERGGVLCTGDAALGKRGAVDQLVDYLGAHRIETLACHQVPHHGALSNSSAYTGKMINAPINIFSADPEHRPYHPHKDTIAHYRAWVPSESDRPRQTLCPLVNQDNFSADIWSAKSKYAARHLELVVEASANGWEFVDQEVRKIRKLWR